MAKRDFVSVCVVAIAHGAPCQKYSQTVISVFGVSIVRIKWSTVDDAARGCRLNALAEGIWRKKLMDGEDIAGKKSSERDRSERDDEDAMTVGVGDL